MEKHNNYKSKLCLQIISDFDDSEMDNSNNDNHFTAL